MYVFPIVFKCWKNVTKTSDLYILLARWVEGRTESRAGSNPWHATCTQCGDPWYWGRHWKHGCLSCRLVLQKVPQSSRLDKAGEQWLLFQQSLMFYRVKFKGAHVHSDRRGTRYNVNPTPAACSGRFSARDYWGCRIAPWSCSEPVPDGQLCVRGFWSVMHLEKN